MIVLCIQIQTVCCLNMKFENSFVILGKIYDGTENSRQNFSFKHIYLEMWALLFSRKIYLCLKVYGWKIVQKFFQKIFFWTFSIIGENTQVIFFVGYNTCHFNPPFKMFLNCFSNSVLSFYPWCLYIRHLNLVKKFILFKINTGF